ncbi:glycosyltransferase family 2 protein [Shimia sediminis]|uniref:glycosyltransferase family 2 protein n=1 Tax=Shimia sediminis TaxID=2497945 RepID=UPI000F8E6286|nr:glycosyltransferase family 2 protein [Shimia sediminis]
MHKNVTYSLVIPFMNEEEVLPMLMDRLEGFMADLDGPAEVMFIDDGSRDNSAALVAERARQDARFKMIRLSRNFGHQIAVTAGLNEANGDAVIIMDADLQDPPEVAHDLIAKWHEGYEIVHAQRRRREGETLFKKVTANLFYRGLARLSSVDIPRDVGDFRLVDARVVRAIRAMPERDRFLRGMFAWVGFRQCLVQFDRPERQAGETKYPLKKMLKLAMDGVIGFSDAPLRLALWLGALVSLGAMLYGAYIFSMALFTDRFVDGWASTVVILSFLSGMNLLISGVIGLFVGRIHNEAKQRPLYFVSESIGLNEVVRLPDQRRLFQTHNALAG